MKKRLVAILFLVGSIFLVGCDKIVPLTGETTKETTKETTTIETTTEEVKQQEIKVLELEDTDKPLLFLPRETKKFCISIPYDGRYNVSISNDIKAVVENGDSFPIEDTFYKEHSFLKLTLTNESNKCVRTKLDFDVSSNLKDIEIDKEYIVSISGDEECYKATFNEDVTIDILHSHWHYPNRASFNSNTITCKRGEYYIIKNNTSSKIKSDLVLTKLDKIELNNTVSADSYAIDILDEGFYTVASSYVHCEIYDKEGLVQSSEMNSANSIYKTAYLKKGTYYIYSTDFSNAQDKEKTITVSKVKKNVDYYVNGEKYRGGMVNFSYGKTYEIEAFVDGEATLPYCSYLEEYGAKIIDKKIIINVDDSIYYAMVFSPYFCIGNDIPSFCANYGPFVEVKNIYNDGKYGLLVEPDSENCKSYIEGYFVYGNGDYDDIISIESGQFTYPNQEKLLKYGATFETVKISIKQKGTTISYLKFDEKYESIVINSSQEN